jgi:hypothetical protein
MLRNHASSIRRCRGIILLVGLVVLVSQLPAQDGGVKLQADRVSASTWGAIPPPPADMIVAFYKNATEMVGLNHVYATSEKLTHRWRSFIPLMSAGVVSVFPFSPSIQPLPSRTPLLYVGHIAAWVSATEPNSRWVHIVRAESRHNSRVVHITSGSSVFSYHPGVDPGEEIPLRFSLLSDTIYTIQPTRPLENGEYLVVFGPSALSGFEFQIACSGARCD